MPQTLYTQTDKALIPTLPRFLFEGKIVVVQSESEARRAVKVLRAAPLVGIDTETRPAFHRGVSYKVALLQLSTHDISFLFRLNQTGLLPCLCDLLSDGSVKKVGLSLKDDLLMLRRRTEFRPAGFIDLQDEARAMGIADMSLQKLFANILGGRISKGARLTNWEADALTEAQQRYAATDAYACILLYERMQALQASGDYQLVTLPTTSPTR